MDLQPDQVYASINGITFGAVDSYGVDWSLVSLDGWGATKPTFAATQRTRQSGASAGKNYAGARPMSLSGMIFAPTAGLLRDAFDRLNAAFTLDPSPLLVTEAGFTRTVNVQRSDDVIPGWEMPTIGTWSVGVTSTDWRKFGDVLQPAATGLPSTSGGLTVPFTIPFTIPATSATGQISLTNPGNATGPVVAHIYGPVVSGAQVSHVSSAGITTFATSLQLAAGEWLDVDMEAQTVLANGTASRARFVTQRGFSGFDPGLNTWSFSAPSFTAGAQFGITATPAWL